MKFFVAHAYEKRSFEDYRNAFKEVQEAFDCKFVFADQEISSEHIFEKIQSLIKDCDCCIFDISTWNANVTLEMGFAVAPARNIISSLAHRNVVKTFPPTCRDTGGSSIHHSVH